MSRRSEFQTVALLALLAFLLRLIDLDGRSPWLDENFTLLRFYSSWEDIFNNIVIRQDAIRTVDINPPLYFALLKAWGQLAGESTFVLRFFSATFAILAVPASYALGYRLTGRRNIALIAAGLALLSPSYQWYANEIRGYSFLLFLGIVNSYSFLKFLKHKRNILNAIIWIITSITTIFTHYSSISIVLVQTVLIILSIKFIIIKIKRKDFIKVLLAFLFILSLLLLSSPFWIPTQWYIVDLTLKALTAPRGQGISPFDWLTEIISALVFGFNAGDPTGTNGIVTILIGLLIILGLNLGLEKQTRIVLYGFIFVPVLFWIALSFFIDNRPSFRYIIFIFPFLNVCQANAIVSLGLVFRRWRPLQLILRISSITLILGSAAFGTAMTFVRTPTWQDDWRSMSEYLRQNWRPGDALAINLYTPERVLDIYLRDLHNLPIDIVPIHLWLQMPPEEARLEINARYQRIWYANTGGDTGLQNSEAQALFAPYLLRSRTPFPSRTNIIELLEYDLRPFVSEYLPAQAIALPSTPARQTQIVGYQIETGNPYFPYPNVWLNLYWRRGAEQDLAYHTVAIRLRDVQNVWWDWSVPARLSPQPASWEGSRILRTSHVIPLPLGLPLQPYQLELQLLAGPKGEIAQVIQAAMDEQTIRCCLRITRWPNQRGQSPHRLSDGAVLAEYPSVLRPNQLLPVVLTWYPAKPHLSNWQTRIKFEGLLGGTVTTIERAAGTPAFPASAWLAGEPVRDPYTLALPPTLSPGIYRLSLERWQDGRKLDGTLLGLLRAEDHPHVPVADRVQHPSDARVGELQLLGYSANQQPRRGQVTDFITHWRVIERPARDGVIFLHLTNGQGKLISQDDNPPIVDGLVRSTVTYRSGEGINQLHRLEIPRDLPAGRYLLFAGVYDRQSIIRWPAQQNGQSAKDNLVFLGAITVE